jgi:hypothetical protein
MSGLKVPKSIFGCAGRQYVVSGEAKLLYHGNVDKCVILDDEHEYRRALGLHAMFLLILRESPITARCDTLIWCSRILNVSFHTVFRVVAN